VDSAKNSALNFYNTDKQSSTTDAASTTVNNDENANASSLHEETDDNLQDVGEIIFSAPSSKTEPKQPEKRRPSSQPVADKDDEPETEAKPQAHAKKPRPPSEKVIQQTTTTVAQQDGKIVTNIINNVRCHISYPTINYCPKINNNNINNFIMAGAPAPGEEEPQQQQFS
jgi:hypothetical protein